ncbi:MAG: HD domain-containing phosphohydrolase [Acidobacteriota bacterium]
MASEDSEEYVLIVDDEPSVRNLIVSQLSFLGFDARAIDDGNDALDLTMSAHPPSLVLMDIEMPGFSGVDLLKQIKQIDNDVQVIMVSGLHDLTTVRVCLREGAYDYLAKPFELEDLANTAQRALERRTLVRQNRAYQKNLERMVDEQTEEIRRTRDIALMTLAKLAESRDSETGLHLERMAEYSRLIGQAMLDDADNPMVSDEEYVSWVHKSSPLHDIGKVGIPDSVLRKPGPLNQDEAMLMRTHTIIGGDTLRLVLERYDNAPSILTMAMEIAYSHHERWDGRGYPEGLRDEQIPLAARIVALADAYDAITSRRPYKEALPHEEAVRRIVKDRGTHFDPVVVDAFMRCQDEFASVAKRMQAEARERTKNQPTSVRPQAAAS